jgi:P pilus assembly chaperone PapD
MKLLTLLSILLSSNLFAWSVKPMSQEIDTNKRTFQIKIDNTTGKEPVAIRLKAMARDTDKFGIDKLSNTNDLLIFPKRMIIGAGKKAVARISVRKQNTSKNEKPYRLIIDQIPVKKQNDEKGIKVLTRYLTSVYLNPKAKKQENFEVNSAKIVDGGIEITATNSGNHHKVILPSSLKIGEVEIDKKFVVKNALAGKIIKIKLPVEGNFSKGQKLSFDNTCMNCRKGENYKINIE